jgi:hypothetical protein
MGALMDLREEEKMGHQELPLMAPTASSLHQHR